VYGVDPKDKVLKAFEGYKYSKSFKKAIFFINNDLDKNKLVETVERIKKINQGIPVEINIRLVDYRKKVPKTKVFLHFFAGTVSSKNILFMSYESVGSNNPAR
jgi:nickel-dependent lactate racemase